MNYIEKEQSHGADKLAENFAQIKGCITWMQSLIVFMNSCRGHGRSMIAPTSVYAVGLIRKTQTKTAVGAISDRQRLRQLLFESIGI